jgi:hypothetical protein
MAWGYKLFSSLLMSDLLLRDHLPCGSRQRSLWLGWLVSNNFRVLPFTPPDIEVLDGMELGPVMYWVARATLRSAMRSRVVHLPYQAVM